MFMFAIYPGTSSVVGYWFWTWTSTMTTPSGTNLAIAYSGWSDPSIALSSAAPILGQLSGTKFISLGGSNSAGAFTATTLSTITSAIQSGAFAQYGGLAFDVEIGDSGLTSAFETAFSAARTMNLKVLVMTTHSAPTGISDANALMTDFIASSNIDYLSPQLYTSGYETINDYSTHAGILWTAYSSAKAAVVPSIVSANLYSDAVTTLGGYGVTCAGFIQWQQQTNIPTTTGKWYCTCIRWLFVIGINIYVTFCNHLNIIYYIS